MKTKLLAILLTAMLATGLLPGTAFTADSNFVIEDGILTEYNGPGGDVVIPDGVTEIGYEAFSNCEKLVSVTIPNSVSYIWVYAFKDCTNLTSVTVPSSVTAIGESAFDGTPWLENQGEFPVINGILLKYQGNGGNVTVPDSVTAIGDSAFWFSKVTSVTFLGNVTAIGKFAFEGCSSLTSVTMPSSVIIIDEFAFSRCDSLKDVYYGGSKSQWKQITIEGWNNSLTSANIHYSGTIPTTPATGFTDVTSGIWYEEAVQWAADKGLMTGTGDGSTFSPDVTTSRAMIVTILARLNGADTEGGSNWYEKGMAWAVANGVSDGTNPGGDISREQLAVMLYRDAGSPSVDASVLDGYPDSSSVDIWAVDGMVWAVANGIINGADGLLAPQTTANRAVAATILQRYCGLAQ